MRRTAYPGIVAAACIALAVGACSDDEDPTGIDDDGAPFRVVIAEDGSAGASPASFGAAGLLAPGTMDATLSLDAVEAITLPVGAVEARETGGAWIEVGRVDDDIDLMDLPPGGLELVETTLEEGFYTGLRLRLTDTPTITLGEEITVGRTVFEAGTHELSIPSSEQTGVKLNADFEVDADGQTLTVLFDDEAAVDRVTATGSGVLKISPVLRVLDEDDDEVGEIDDDEDEGSVEFDGFVQSVGEGELTLTDGTLIVVDADTEIEGDILTLAAVAAAVTAGESVEVEGSGEPGAAAGTVIATEIEFEVDDDDGDGDDEDEDEEFEVEGTVTAVDRGDTEVTVDVGGESVTVVFTVETEVTGDFETFGEMADAFDAGATLHLEAEGTLVADARLVADDVEVEEHEAEFEGAVTAVTTGVVESFTVLLDSGLSLTVNVVGATDVDTGGDFDTFAEMAAAFESGADIRAEGWGVEVGSSVLAASEVEFELDD